MKCRLGQSLGWFKLALGYFVPAEEQDYLKKNKKYLEV